MFWLRPEITCGRTCWCCRSSVFWTASGDRRDWTWGWSPTDVFPPDEIKVSQMMKWLSDVGLCRYNHTDELQSSYCISTLVFYIYNFLNISQIWIWPALSLTDTLGLCRMFAADSHTSWLCVCMCVTSWEAMLCYQRDEAGSWSVLKTRLLGHVFLRYSRWRELRLLMDFSSRHTPEDLSEPLHLCLIRVGAELWTPLFK